MSAPPASGDVLATGLSRARPSRCRSRRRGIGEAESVLVRDSDPFVPLANRERPSLPLERRDAALMDRDLLPAAHHVAAVVGDDAHPARVALQSSGLARGKHECRLRLDLQLIAIRCFVAVGPAAATDASVIATAKHGEHDENELSCPYLLRRFDVGVDIRSRLSQARHGRVSAVQQAGRSPAHGSHWPCGRIGSNEMTSSPIGSGAGAL